MGARLFSSPVAARPSACAHLSSPACLRPAFAEAKLQLCAGRRTLRVKRDLYCHSRRAALRAAREGNPGAGVATATEDFPTTWVPFPSRC